MRMLRSIDWTESEKERFARKVAKEIKAGTATMKAIERGAKHVNRPEKSARNIWYKERHKYIDL